MSNLQMAVGFNKKTGIIRQIAHPPVDFDNFILVPFEIVKGIMEGTESRKKYRVLFDDETKSYQLTRVENTKSTGLDINLFHYEVPKSNETSNLTIIRSIKNNNWKIILDNEIRQNLLNFKTNEMIHLSITEPGDMNILYRYIGISFDKLKDEGTVEIPFTTDFEKDNKSVSIYTSKRFKTYSYKVEE